MNSLGIHIKVKDFNKSKAFYDALGLKSVFSYGPDQKVKEEYSGIVYDIHGTSLEIANGHRAVKSEVFSQSITSSKISLMIKVDNLPDIIARCSKNHIPIVVTPRHYYWETLEMVIKDPDGTVIVFISPYSQTQAQLVQADEKWSKAPDK